MCRNFHWPVTCVLVLVLANTSNGSLSLLSNPDGEIGSRDPRGHAFQCDAK